MNTRRVFQLLFVSLILCGLIGGTLFQEEQQLHDQITRTEKNITQRNLSSITKSDPYPLTTVEPLAFYFIDEEKGDDSFLTLTPISVFNDSKGRYHVWYLYRGEKFINMYYEIISEESTYIYLIDEQPVDKDVLPLLFQQQLVELPNGTVIGVFPKATDFDIELKIVSWNPQEKLQIATVEFQEDFQFKGNIFGPVFDEKNTVYYYAYGRTQLNEKAYVRLAIDEKNKGIVFQTYILDTIWTSEFGSALIIAVFDAAFANSTQYLLAAIGPTYSNGRLMVLKENKTQPGTFFEYASFGTFNAAPLLSASNVVDFILTDIFKPNLIALNYSSLYSFVLSHKEFGVSYLVNWKGNETYDVFNGTYPYDVIFFPPLIKAVNGLLKFATIGVQYAQETVLFTLDIFTYSPVTREFAKAKYSHVDFSLAAGLYYIDLSTTGFLAVYSSQYVAERYKTDYRIGNDTVGALFLLSSAERDVNEHLFLDLYLLPPPSHEGKTDYQSILIGGILVLFASLLSLWVYVTYFKTDLELLPRKGEKERKRKLNPFYHLSRQLRRKWAFHYLFAKANKRRYAISILILILPSLLLLATLVGLQSQYDALLQTYEHQRPLNDRNDLNPYPDGLLFRSFYKDEYSLTNFSATDFFQPRQLFQTYSTRFQITAYTSQFSSITYFPLFEKRSLEYQNETYYYSFNHNFAVVENSSKWRSFLETRLTRGRLPQKPTEVLLQDGWSVPIDIYNREKYPSGSFWQLNSTLTLYASELDIYLNFTYAHQSQNLTIVGMIAPIESMSFEELSSWAENLGTTTMALRRLDSVPFYLFPQQAADLLNGFSKVSLFPMAAIDVRYDILSLDRDQIPEILNRFQSFNDTQILETGIPWVGRFNASRILTFLKAYYYESGQVQLQGILWTVPVLSLILIVTYESLAIGKSSIQQEVERFKRDGLKTSSIIELLLVERAIETTVGLGIACFFVEPVALLFLQFTGLFELSSRSPPLSTQHFWLFVAALFVLLFGTGLVQSLTWLQGYTKWTTIQSRWKGILKDITILAVAGGVIALANMLSETLQEQLSLSSTSEETTLSPTTETLLLLLNLLAVLIGLLAIILILTRVLFAIVRTIGRVGWKTVHKPWALAFKGLQHHTDSYMRPLLVVLISFFLIMPMFIVPSTMNNQFVSEAYEQLGTDMQVYNWSRVETTIQQQVLRDSRLESVSEYYYGYFSVKNLKNIQTLAINQTNFVETLRLPSTYLSTTLSYNLTEYVQRLENLTILASATFLRRNALSVGSSILLRFENLLTLKLKIVGSYQVFPIFASRQLVTADKTQEISIVMNLETLNSIKQKMSINATDASKAQAYALEKRDLLVKVKKGKIDEVNLWIRELTNLKTKTVLELIEEKRPSFYRAFEMLIHISLVVATAAPLLTIFTAGNVLFERRKEEMEVIRKIGKPLSFHISNLSLELMLAVILPGSLGLLLGDWWSKTFGLSLFGEQQINTQELFTTDFWVDETGIHLYGPHATHIDWQYQISLILVWVIGMIALTFGLWIIRLWQAGKRYLREVRS